MKWGFHPRFRRRSPAALETPFRRFERCDEIHIHRSAMKRPGRIHRLRRYLRLFGWSVVALLILGLAAIIWVEVRLERIGGLLHDATEEMQSATERISDSFSTTTTHGETRYLGELKFDVFFVTRDGPPLEFFFLTETGERFATFDRLREYLHAKGKRLRFSTNAGIFLEVAAPSRFLPEGLFVQDGKEIVPLNTHKGNGNFYLEPNGVFAVTHDGYAVVDTAAYPDLRAVVHATQSGPLLVHKGRINRQFSTRSDKLNIRSGVGIIDPQTAVFVISRQPVSFYQFARFFLKVLRCKNALYLDGAISQTYLPELGRHDSGGDFAGLIALSEDESTP